MLCCLRCCYLSTSPEKNCSTTKPTKTLSWLEWESTTAAAPPKKCTKKERQACLLFSRLLFVRSYIVYKLYTQNSITNCHLIPLRFFVALAPAILNSLPFFLFIAFRNFFVVLAAILLYSHAMPCYAFFILSGLSGIYILRVTWICIEKIGKKPKNKSLTPSFSFRLLQNKS